MLLLQLTGDELGRHRAAGGVTDVLLEDGAAASDRPRRGCWAQPGVNPNRALCRSQSMGKVRISWASDRPDGSSPWRIASMMSGASVVSFRMRATSVCRPCHEEIEAEVGGYSGAPAGRLSARTAQDPYPVYAALRARDPVHRSRVLKAWVFTRHGQEHLTKLARDIIADNELRDCLGSSAETASSHGSPGARPDLR